VVDAGATEEGVVAGVFGLGQKRVDVTRDLELAHAGVQLDLVAVRLDPDVLGDVHVEVVDALGANGFKHRGGVFGSVLDERHGSPWNSKCKTQNSKLVRPAGAIMNFAFFILG